MPYTEEKIRSTLFKELMIIPAYDREEVISSACRPLIRASFSSHLLRAKPLIALSPLTNDCV